MASLSEMLRRERELRGISLKQISEETKIGVRFLEALEDGRLELIPGDFYRRSYIRAYARYLGLDDERAVNDFDFHRRQRADPEAPARPPQTIAPWIGWVAASLLIGTVAGIGLMTGSDATEAPQPPGEPEEIDGYSEPAAPQEIPALLNPSPAPSGLLRLVIAVDEPCWLEIEADGEIVTSGLMEAGFRRELSASREVRLWLGNAGGVSLWVNESKVRSLGRSGQVLKGVSITPDNYRTFLASDRS